MTSCGRRTAGALPEHVQHRRRGLRPAAGRRPRDPRHRRARDHADGHLRRAERRARTGSRTRSPHAASQAGDRVALILSQRPETALAHVAIYKLGAIAVPLSSAFGPDALEVRLRGAEPRAVLGERTRSSGSPRSASTACSLDVDRDLPSGSSRPPRPTSPRRRRRPTRRRCSSTPPARPARRRARCTAIACSPGTCPASSSRTTSSRSPATGSGRPPTGPGSAGSTTSSCRRSRTACPSSPSGRARFDPEQAFDVMARVGIRNVFMPATALRLMRRAGGVPVVAAHARERRRDGRRGDGGVVRGALRRAAERVLRADRGEPPDRQLRRLARAARLDGPGLPGPRAAARRRRDRRSRRG